MMPSAAGPAASSTPSGRKPEPYSAILSFRPAAAYPRMNLAAPPPAKKQATASGCKAAISVSRALEFDVRKGQAQFLDDAATGSRIALLEALEGFLAGSVLPGDPDGLFVASCDHRRTQRQRDLRVGERGAEHIRGAQCPGGRMRAGVGDQAEHAGLACHLLNAHLHARM